MKSFFTALCFFNILNACTIDFVDKIETGGVTYGYMKFFSDINKSQRCKRKPTNVCFLNKSSHHIGNSVACWKHCNRTKIHRGYNVCSTDVVKKEHFGEIDYQVCVFSVINGMHAFDMHVFRNPISENYEITIFKDIQNYCVFMNTFLKDKAICCTFPDNGLIEILQSYE